MPSARKNLKNMVDESDTITILKNLIELSQSSDSIDPKNIDCLIGHIEGEHFEAKQEFYNFSSNSNKKQPKDTHEFCKDITAFANHKGGYLLFGCGTVKQTSSRIDIVKKLSGIESFPDQDQLNSILGSHIYPKSIVNLIRYHKINLSDDKRFFLIEIMKARPEDQPYLVVSHPSNNEFIAYCVRASDRVIRVDVKRLHELVGQGLYFENYLKNITGACEKTLENTERILKKLGGSTSSEKTAQFNLKEHL